MKPLIFYYPRIENNKRLVWRETLLTKEFEKMSWFMYFLPMLKLFPERCVTKLIISLQTKFLDYISYKYSDRKNIVKTYGGFLENRSNLIGFLEESCKDNMTHLGIDINNIEPGTLIKVPCDVEIVHVLKDKTRINGWGGRIIMKMKDNWGNSPYLLYGHLSHDNLPSLGQTFKKNQIVAKLGDTHENGGWFPHLHVQCITQKFYDEYIDNLDLLDGYLFEPVDYMEFVSDPTNLIFQK